MFEKKNILRSGRRTFVKRLMGLGMTGEAAKLMDKDRFDTLVANPKHEVPRLGFMRHTNREAIQNGERPKREPVFYTIPRREWELTRASSKIARRIGGQFSSDEIIGGIVGDARNGETGVRINYEVYIDDGERVRSPDISFEEVKRRVPKTASATVERRGKATKVTDIPVEVVRERMRPQDERNFFDRTIRGVPGGCEAANDVNLTGDGYTLATPTYDNTNDKYVIATAGHAYSRTTGVSIYQNSNSLDNYIGDSGCYLEQGNGDAGIIHLNSDTDFSYDIAAKDSASSEYFEPVWGTATKERCRDLAANNGSAYVQGMRTGRHDSTVLQFKEPSETNDTGYKVELDADTSGGDSGGTYFEVRDDGFGNKVAYIIGINAFEAYDSSGDLSNCAGSCMFYVENELKLTT